MNNFGFLAYFASSFSPERSMMVVSDDEAEAREVSLEDLVLFRSPLLTYDARAVVDMLRRQNRTLPAQLVDVVDALKIQSGLSRDDGGEPYWDVWGALEPLFEVREDQSTLVALIQSRVQCPERNEVYRLLTAAVKALRELWMTTVRSLKLKGEYQRFVDIEIPVQQIFLARQRSGIRVDREILSQTLEKVRNEKYSAFRYLASVLGFSPSGLTFHDVAAHLHRTDASHLVEYSGQSNFEEYFKIAQCTSVFASMFLRFIRAAEDLRILTGATGTTGVMNPEFKCFGTVTGRILVAHPRLQELRKQYRNILRADDGHVLVYLDYAQFEPGILASLMNDQSLRNAFQTTDLYSSFSEVLFGNREHREECKRVFLAFCFGMSVDNIAKLLSGAEFSLERLVRYRDAITAFFRTFAGLEDFRLRAQDQLVKNGFASSLMGNRRIRKTSGPLSGKESRWALNHLIQGTASLIFKHALVLIAEKLGKECVLLPMHDAVLLQFESEIASTATDTASLIMREAFSVYCPNVTPRVVQGNFAPN